MRGSPPYRIRVLWIMKHLYVIGKVLILSKKIYQIYYKEQDWSESQRGRRKVTIVGKKIIVLFHVSEHLDTFEKYFFLTKDRKYFSLGKHQNNAQRCKISKKMSDIIKHYLSQLPRTRTLVRFSMISGFVVKE